MKSPPQIIISEHGIPSYVIPQKWLNLISLIYPKSDLIISISQAVANDLLKILPSEVEKKLKVIYNPTYSEKIFKKAEEKIEHPFFKEGVSVILSVGRLHSGKDFPTLLKAFSIVCKKKEVRLIILGEGNERKNLEKMITELGIQDKVNMPGFTLNPYPYMKNSSVFVLSSKSEGLSNVLIEAMCCGCPIVATDCGGPREILDNGKYGKLVPVGDYEKMAEAILETIDNPPSPEFLIGRAKQFSLDKKLKNIYK